MIKQKVIKEFITERPKGMYELPKGWQWVRLSDPGVCEIIMGQSPPGNTYNKEGNGLPFYQGKVDFSDIYPIPSTWCTEPKKIAKPKDILISVRAPVGPTNICKEECCIGRGLSAIRVTENTEYLFIFYLLKLIEREISDIGKGSTFNAIRKKDLENLIIPLPTLSEQKRIASKILELMQKIEHARTACEKQLEAVEALPSSFLREVFESEEAKKWERKRLGEVCNIQTGKRDVNEGAENGKYLFYTCAAEPLRSNSFSFEGESIILPGNGANVGLVLFYNGKFEAYQRTYILNHFKCIAKYVYYNLLLYWNEYNKDKQSGSATNYIRLGNIQNYPIFLPPFSIQNHIISELKEKMSEVDKLRDSIEKQLEAINALPQAILKKAFRGDL